MKNILIPLTLLFYSSYCVAQSVASQKKPVLFVDSVRVSEHYFNHLSTDNFASLDIKRPTEYPDGVIYITSKSKEQTQNLLGSALLSLGDIVNKHVPKEQKHRPVIFLLDGKMLTDTVDVRLPSVAVRVVSVVRAEDTPYFKTALPNVLVLMIKTKIDIVIRGAAGDNDWLPLDK